MRVMSLIVVGALAVSTASAQRRNFRRIQPAEAEKLAASSYIAPQGKIAMWIWSDKYTYAQGETLKLSWTVKTNSDLYPYTVVAYRQNNQTGVKTYLPGGTGAATDVYGNTPDQGFQPTQLTDVPKAAFAIGTATGNVTIPANEPGMHTIVVQLRDYTGTRILKSAYMKFGVVTETVTLSSAITADTTLVNTKLYKLSGVVAVRAVLTIEPGTIIEGTPGSQPPSVLLITQNGRIEAAGTKSRPIIMTSDQPFGARTRGDWGGLILLGKAPINVPANVSGGATCGPTGCNNAAGSFYIEGLVANPDGLYGGSDPAHNCGTLEFVRVEYAGSILSTANEVNSITFGGCGTGTTAHHLQALYGSDDAFEWFGGTMNAKYLVGGLCADDYVDFQLGYTGKIQYGLFYYNADYPGNRGIEGDNSEYDQASVPFSNPTVFNLTFVGAGTAVADEQNAAGIYLRRGSRGSFNNIVVTNFNGPAIQIADANTQAQVASGDLKINSVLYWNNNVQNNGANTLEGQFTDAPTLGYVTAGTFTNLLNADPKFVRGFEFDDPDFRGMFSSPIFRTGWTAPPDDGFFDQTATFIGGIGDYDWTEEWTSFLEDADIAP